MDEEELKVVVLLFLIVHSSYLSHSFGVCGLSWYFPFRVSTLKILLPLCQCIIYVISVFYHSHLCLIIDCGCSHIHHNKHSIHSYLAKPNLLPFHPSKFVNYMGHAPLLIILFFTSLYIQSITSWSLFHYFSTLGPATSQ